MNSSFNSDLQTALFWDRVMRSQETGVAAFSEKTKDTVEFQGGGEKHPRVLQCKPYLFNVKFGWSQDIQKLNGCGFARLSPRKI